MSSPCEGCRFCYPVEAGLVRCAYAKFESGPPRIETNQMRGQLLRDGRFAYPERYNPMGISKCSGAHPNYTTPPKAA